MGKEMMREGGKTDITSMTLYSKYFISNSITNHKNCGLAFFFFFNSVFIQRTNSPFWKGFNGKSR